jgi:uncharacterized protein
MTILVDASLKCNFNCAYCYNQLKRKLNAAEIDVESIKAGIKAAFDAKYSSDITLHGGEPLSWGKDVVEELLSYIYRLGGRCGIQTNGSLIDDEYIEMFKKYNVSLGVSIDGYHPLNALRCDEATTKLIVQNIHRLVDARIPTGIISVVHRYNALPKHYEPFKQFVSDMHSLGVKGRINPCVLDREREGLGLTVDEALAFYLEMADYVLDKGIDGYSPFSDVANSLQGKPEVFCTFGGCDPYSTRGGVIVTHSGMLSFCDKFGTTFYERDSRTCSTRFEVLSQTDCRGCRYLYHCGGGCPANAAGGDWRNKDRWCRVWYSLFDLYERRLRSMGVQVNVREGPACGGAAGTNRPHGDHWETVRGA